MNIKFDATIENQQVYTENLLPPLNKDSIDHILKFLWNQNHWKNVQSSVNILPLALTSKSWASYLSQLSSQDLAKQIKLEAQASTLKKASFPKLLNCHTARKAVDYIIANNFTVANLEEFPDLTEDLLEELMIRAPQVVHLAIKSPLVKQLPASCERLQTLICRDSGIEKLPASMPHLSWLDCSECAIATVPSYPNLLRLYCYSCSNLQSITSGMALLQELYCQNNPLLENLPSGMCNATKIECSDCPLLRDVPADMKKLKDFHCFGMPKLVLPPDFENTCIVYRECFPNIANQNSENEFYYSF